MPEPLGVGQASRFGLSISSSHAKLATFLCNPNKCKPGRRSIPLAVFTVNFSSMAFRLPARRLAAAAGRRYLSSSSRAAVGSNLSQNAKQAIAHEASVPNPDPAEDSASAAMINEHAKYMLATYARPPPVFVRGEGSYLYDLENRKYLDFTSGIAVNSLGHCDPGVWNVIADQVSI